MAINRHTEESVLPVLTLQFIFKVFTLIELHRDHSKYGYYICSCRKIITFSTDNVKLFFSILCFILVPCSVLQGLSIPWLLALASRVDSTMNTANPSCRFLRCPSVHGSFHEPKCGTICPKLARTARGRTSRSSRRAALRSYRTHSRDKSRQGYKLRDH